jgi:hypothetical protein
LPYLCLDGLEALRGEHTAIEGELATVGDRGATAAAFN